MNPVWLTSEYKARICAVARLGKKGYTIPKSALHPDDLEFLRKDLFVKPQTQGPSYGPENNPFPVFRENAAKMYLPRFYGIERYGAPSVSEIQIGDDIQVEFAKPIRDYQEEIIGVYMNHVRPTETGGGILEVPCGRGKCLGKDTPVLMFDGTIKMVQDIVVGDQIMGDDSGPRNILSTCSGRETMVEIMQVGRTGTVEYYQVNMSHILSLKHKLTNEVVDMSLEEYLNHLTPQHLLGYRVPIVFPESPISHDPYMYGLDYADGRMEKYICNSRRIQLELLAGLADKFVTTKNKAEYQFCIPAKYGELCDSILYVTRSLGFEVILDIQMIFVFITLRSTDRVNLREIPTRHINLDRYEASVFTLGSLTYEIQAKVIKEDDYYGFEIDGNRRFVLGDFTVTHNTVMALKIISLLQKKTLILVHKEFLMNQWIERAAEFVPSARIGKIQAATFDIQNKDIVIGMIQTLYDKEYPIGTFDSFGLTIIDEVHRIGSEQFSRTLFKTITPYMLGISATVERKDKLTKVLYMFIGPKIYSENRKDTDPVCVRAITYCSRDTEFNAVETDFRGNTKTSTMITKLCAFGPRSDFIIKVIADLLAETDNQIMVLAHNRSLLTYLHEAIVHRSIATVGYYVGGMKPAKLTETETKQIVLATYAMAAEALDIKTLATLIMVTPKTDIIQSVGRILRVKHESPIIVDIVDQHESFQNQWAQRRRFYKKCNYRIRQILSTDYAGMSIDWATDQSWKRVFEPKESIQNDSAGAVDEDDEPKQGKCLIDPSLFT
jgi:superfamily II DNA or RNA helicase